MSDGSVPVTKDQLDELERTLTPLARAGTRAKGYAESDTREGFFVGFSGMSSVLPSVVDTVARPLFETLPGANAVGFELFAVDNPPGVVHLASALSPDCQHLYANLGHAASAINFEVFISSRIASTPRSAVKLAHRITYSLRVRSSSFFRAIACADCSWNSIAARSKSVHAMLLGEEWHQRAQWPSDQFDESDVQWVADNLIRVFELYKETRFQLAFDAAGAAPYVENQRVAIAQMWSGIEAIFGVQQELSYRLGLYLAVLTEDGHVERSAVQAEVKSLYSKRSKAVHGVEMKDHELRDAALGSWRLLARAIIALVDLAEPPPSAARLDRAGLSS